MRTRTKLAGIAVAGSALAVVLILAMIPQASVSANFPITYPPMPEPEPEPEPEQDYRGWMAGHMSDRAKDCEKSGLGRPWCVLLYGLLSL